MRTEMFIKSFRADAAIAPHRIVKAGASDGNAAQAAAATDASLGISDSLGAGIGQTCDVVAGGYATVEYGDVVTRGDPLTADADGKAVKATVASSRLVGFAIVSGVAGDFGTAHVQLGFL
jgi:hypothetical protein